MPGIYSLEDVLANSTQIEGGTTVINFGEGNTLTLSNVPRASLVAGDFIFAPAPVNDAPDFTGDSVGESSRAIRSRS